MTPIEAVFEEAVDADIGALEGLLEEMQVVAKTPTNARARTKRAAQPASRAGKGADHHCARVY